MHNSSLNIRAFFADLFQNTDKISIWTSLIFALFLLFLSLLFENINLAFLTPAIGVMLFGILLMIKFPLIWVYSTILFLASFWGASSEGVSYDDVIATVYLLGGLLIWFVWQFLKKEKLCENKLDWLLLFTFALMLLNSIVSVQNDVLFIDWAREYGIFALVLYYFPFKKYLKTSKDLKIFLIVLAISVFIVDLKQFYTYYVALTSKDLKYVYELTTSVRWNQTLFTAASTFGIIFIFSLKKNLHRIFLLLFTFATISALITSYSRTFWVILAINIFILFLFLNYKNKVKLMLTIAALFLFLGSIIILFAKDKAEIMFDILENRVASTSKGTKDPSLQARFAEWEKVNSQIAYYPLSGNGFGKRFTFKDPLHDYQRYTLVIHNGYLYFAYRFGIPLAVCLILIILFHFYKLAFLTYKIKDDFVKSITLGAFLILLLLLIADYTSAQFVSRDGVFALAFAFTVSNFANKYYLAHSESDTKVKFMPVKNSIGENQNFASFSRYKTIRTILIFIALIFVVRLVQIQLLEGSEYQIESETQAIKRVRIEPFRGNLYDRFGKLMVHNEPSFAITITPAIFKEETKPLLASLLDIDTNEVNKLIKKAKSFSPFQPAKIDRDISPEKMALFVEYADYLTGIDVISDSKRLYEFDVNMAHLLGYTKEITRNELKKMTDYIAGDIIGKQGVEKAYQKYLHGSPGYEFLAVNKFGQKVASFDNGKQDIKAINGNDLVLSINLEMQILAEKLLENKRGAIIAIDPNNGEVLCFASKPDYDLKLFSGKLPNDIYQAIANDDAKPLLPRALASEYPPGSAWKMVIATAGLQEGIINKNSTFHCNGGYQYGNRYAKCMHVHGTINVMQAIKGSCNAYFYQLALKCGIDNVIKYGKLYGFGADTGIDLPNERDGNYPSVAELQKKWGKNVPGGVLMNFGIGQGEILVTPLQLAVYTATMANRGVYNQPHTVRAIKDSKTRKEIKVNYEKKSLGINPEVYDVIHQGMWDVVNSPGGTGSSSRIVGKDVCGKTSTAQNPHGIDHGWFVCFAPRVNPQIAIAVFVENAGSGGRGAAPFAHKILQKHFNPSMTIEELLNSGTQAKANSDSTVVEIED